MNKDFEKELMRRLKILQKERPEISVFIHRKGTSVKDDAFLKRVNRDVCKSSKNYLVKDTLEICDDRSFVVLKTCNDIQKDVKDCGWDDFMEALERAIDLSGSLEENPHCANGFSKEYLKKYMTIQIVPYRKRELEGYLYRRYGDIAEIVSVEVENMEDGVCMFAKISKSAARYFFGNDENIFRIAEKNMERLHPLRAVAVCTNGRQELLSEVTDAKRTDASSHVLIYTSDLAPFGCAALFYPKTREMLERFFPEGAHVIILGPDTAVAQKITEESYEESLGHLQAINAKVNAEIGGTISEYVFSYRKEEGYRVVHSERQA